MHREFLFALALSQGSLGVEFAANQTSGEGHMLRPRELESPWSGIGELSDMEQSDEARIEDWRGTGVHSSMQDTDGHTVPQRIHSPPNSGFILSRAGAHLARLRSQNLRDGWDGHGARAPSQSAFDMAESVGDELLRRGLREFRYAVDVDGGVDVYAFGDRGYAWFFCSNDGDLIVTFEEHDEVLVEEASEEINVVAFVEKTLTLWNPNA